MSVVDIPAEKALEEMPPVADAGNQVSLAIHKVFLSSEPTRKIADFLHGTWLGHPLHIVLTDFTIGAWAMASLFDAAGAVADDDELRKVGDHLTTAGTLSAVPTAVTGLVEYSTLPQPSATAATLHGLLNAVNFGIYSASVAERRRGNHTRGAIYSAIGFGMTFLSAWLGGKLVYTYKLGVDHSDKFEKPERWTAVCDEGDLPMRKPTRVEFDGKPIVLFRDGPDVYALGAACADAERLSTRARSFTRTASSAPGTIRSSTCATATSSTGRPRTPSRPSMPASATAKSESDSARRSFAVRAIPRAICSNDSAFVAFLLPESTLARSWAWTT